MNVAIYGVNYHIETVGRGEPLVLLHGFTGSGANWAAHIHLFADHCQAITVDLLGHGQTDSPARPDRYRVENAARDLIALFDQLQLGRVHLLGYSMGGRLALYTAIHYPNSVHRLILESASPGLQSLPERKMRAEQDDRLANHILRDRLVPFVDYWGNLPLWDTQTPEIRAQLREQRLQNNPLGLRNSLLGMGTGVQPSLWDNLPSLNMPTLLIAGEHDDKFASIAQQMQALIPDCRLTVIPSAGHATHVEQPEHFGRAVIHFLNSRA